MCSSLKTSWTILSTNSIGNKAINELFKTNGNLEKIFNGKKQIIQTKNETLNAVDDSFMKAIQTVRDLITEDNSSLTFFSELEKSITKEASGQKQTSAITENETKQKKPPKRNSKYPMQEKMRKKRSHPN